MARLAAAGDELLEVSPTSRCEREGPSYTFRTLELLREQRPDDELTFLMGADVAADLERWREPERVLELARLGIAARPGTGLDEAEAALERLGASDRARTGSRCRRSASPRPGSGGGSPRGGRSAIWCPDRSRR